MQSIRIFTFPGYFLALAGIMLLFSSCQQEDPHVLVFTKTSGFYHTSIPAGVEAIKRLGAENGFAVDTTSNSELFTEENLQNYAAVIFLSTTGEVLNHYQEADFERFIQAGGGYVGIHAAADTEYHWGWYGRLVGGYFLDHPGINDPHPNVQEGIIEVVDHSHPSTGFLPEQWVRTDEWYSYQNFNENVNVLMTLDESSYDGGVQMGYHPIAWYHEYDGGRAFYTGGGHTSESYEEELFLRHLLEGIKYAIGDNRLDYSLAKTHRVPEENRFTKTMLVTGELYEPTEMAILPNLDVLIAQRRGEILLYKNDTGDLSQAGFLDVYFETDVPNVNAEEGVIGIAIDPDFEENQFVFIFYTPSDTSVNRLSRFVFNDDQIDMQSETMILEFHSDRDICCHTGGSLAFDSDGLLYASTGDNATPFNQPNQPYQLDGYAPLDERPGFEQYDARRTSGNTNDLRGKILRIQVNEDGSYDIPDGNLFPEGMDKTRPEIYVLGTRNPYRITIDPKTNYLYWGDVGPDARADSIGVRGSLGYDEINQTREAGNYGWPFFVGDNFPYNEYDYETGTPGMVFDPERPLNRSPHNTGLEELPPAKPAFIWYPYTESEEFPEVGTGGRNAMAGPVYYTDLYPEETRMPDYYDGKFFIYEWIRDWIKVVTMQPNGDYDKMEPFMDSTTFASIIDMEVGPDGRLYLLEYGKGWFSQNPDAGLSRIDFNPGNRAPVVHNIRADRTSGLLPLQVRFDVDAEDPENDPLTYHWEISTGEVIQTDDPYLTHTFDEIGDYNVAVEVRDPEQLADRSELISVYAGNTAPDVFIDILGNQTFYFPDHPVEYSLRVRNEGPDGVSDTIVPENLFVSADYIEASDDADESESAEGHLIVTDVILGQNLVATLGCRACHGVASSSIGPSYTEMAERYRDDDASELLADRIIQGSAGVWGAAAMPAHPTLSQADAGRIVSWIESLIDEDESMESLPQTGTLEPTLGEEWMQNGLLVISASYTDEGGENIRPLTGHRSVSLRSSVMGVPSTRNLVNYNQMEFGGNPLLMVPEETGSFSINGIDLTGVSLITINGGSQEELSSGYQFELRLGSPDGDLVGDGILDASSIQPGEGFISYVLSIDIDPVTDGELHDLYFVSRPVNPDDVSMLLLTAFGFQLE
jgi:cytochrome c